MNAKPPVAKWVGIRGDPYPPFAAGHARLKATAACMRVSVDKACTRAASGLATRRYIHRMSDDADSADMLRCPPLL
jgi:hypothetical protein